MIEHAGTCSIDTLSNRELRFCRGDGGCVFSQNGESYYDFILGFGPVVIGHADSEYNSIVTSYLCKGIHFPSYSVFHEILASEIEKYGWQAVSFFKTSSESVTAAIRIAMHATGRKEIYRCGFLGWHDAQIASTGSWHEPPKTKFRANLRFTKNFRGVSGEEKVWNWLDFNLYELEEKLRERKIAAFIMDAYQLYYTNVETVIKSFELCRKYGTITVFDETKTSGRVAFLGLSEVLGLKSDLLILGKAIANGAPLSILCGKKELTEYARAARITGTFSKEVLSVYCALATRKIMVERDGYQQLKKIGVKLTNLFNSVAAEINLKDEICFMTVFGGGMYNLEFAPEVYMNMQKRKQLRLILASNGILMLQGHPSFVCLAHNSIDETDLMKRTKNAFREWNS